MFRNAYGLKRDLLQTLLKRNQIVLSDSIYLSCPPPPLLDKRYFFARLPMQGSETE